MLTPASPPVLPRSARFPAQALLYAGFAATGVALALPGALMPSLLARWALRDEQAGLLFFLFFLGSTLGALSSRGSLHWSIARGAACTAVAAAVLATAPRAPGFFAVLLFGFGLGITMTSISLLQSQRNAANRASELTRLNLLWAAGACSAPWVLLHKGVLDGAHAGHVVLLLAGFFAVFAGGVAISKPVPTLPATPRVSNRRHVLALPLLLMVSCATGVESSCGGWLATYAHRSGDSLGVTISAPTLFWAGLLLSRLLHSSSRVGSAARSFLLSWNLFAMTAALAALIALRSGTLMLGAAFVIGFAAGPVYPLLLALALERDAGNGIFVLAGVGAATLPLLTGMLSAGFNSLRAGLAAPCLAAAAMAIAGWRLRESAGHLRG